MEAEPLALGVGEAPHGIDGGIHDLVAFAFAVGDDHDRNVAEFEVRIGRHPEIDDGFQPFNQFRVVAEQGKQVVVGQDVVGRRPLQRFPGFKEVAKMLESPVGRLVDAKGSPPDISPCA